MLNLLSPTKKEEVKLKKVYLGLKNIIEVFLIFTILTAIILLFSKYNLQKKFNEVVSQTTLTSGTHQELDQKIKALNIKLKDVENIQKEFIAWSKVLEHFSRITPSAVEISSLALDKDKKIVDIRGKAIVRENLLIFEENLKKSEIFTEIKSPIANILIRENIDFQFTAKLDLEKIESL